MNERVETCQDCKHTFTTRVLRYVKGPEGKWDYLCTQCRIQRKLPPPKVSTEK